MGWTSCRQADSHPAVTNPRISVAVYTQGISLRDIVMRARVPPHRVRSFYREWTRSLEQGPAPDEHALGDGAELETLAAAAEDLFARKG
jgi:hypothetical protein